MKKGILFTLILAHGSYSFANMADKIKSLSPITLHSEWIKDPHSPIPGARYLMDVSPRLLQSLSGLGAGALIGAASYLGIGYLANKANLSQEKIPRTAIAGSIAASAATALATRKYFGNAFAGGVFSGGTILALLTLIV